MLQICRADDGYLFEVNTSIWDMERMESLDYFLQEETGVQEDAILAYLSDGRRLQKENIRDLAGMEDQTIYVFNKTYLDLDLDFVLRRLRVEAPLQLPVEETIVATPPFRPSVLASSYVRTIQVHHEELIHIAQSLRYQHEALRIASGSLDLHVLAIQDACEATTSNAQRELDTQNSLLSGLDADLLIAGRVIVHKEFLSANVKKAMELGDPGRTLADYISPTKMRQVAAACTRIHEELRSRLQHVQDLMRELQAGTDEVRAVVTDTKTLDEADICARKSKETVKKVTDLSAALDSPSSEPDRMIQDIRQLDTSLRSELEKATQRKNAYTEIYMRALRKTSVLNNNVVQLPPTLSSLQASLRAKTSFSHIQRLHNMLYAYGATVIEVVRRKEFAEFFYQRASSVLEVMAKLSANERKRRQIYRGEVQGQLPFDTKAMDTPVPTFDYSPTGTSDSPYELNRADVNDFIEVLDDLERFAREHNDNIALKSVQETRTGLEKLIAKMDSLESGFDRIAERSLLSSSRLLEHRRRNTEADERAFAELEERLLRAQRTIVEKDEQLERERSSHEREVEQLQDADSRFNQVERELHAVRAQLQSETTSRRIQEQRNAELTAEEDSQRKTLADALSEAGEKAREVELIRQELAQVRSEFEDVKALEQRNADKMRALLEEQANTLRRLEEARARGEDLESQIQAARTESDEVKRALAEAAKDKDRLLRVQASEHERRMRDQKVEADGDRAVLERQYQELKAALDDAQRQLKDARAQADMSNSDAVGLREELQRVEHELREARHVERVLREDIRAGRASQSDYEQRLESSGRLIAQILDVALAFRESHVKAYRAAESMTSHPSSSRVTVVNHLDEPSPIDPSDPTAALETLRAVDHDQFLEIINKAGQTIRKWQKQCKEYREKAKGKISFRNFAKSDLALFLPTRNSVTKPWAAFNVSFPHYFLKATGHLAEQLKTREWIVARITSIAEGVVDHNDPSTNPYGLGDGVKYYMLEVEDWTQPSQTSRRRSVKRASTSPNPSEPATMVSTPEPTPGRPNPDPDVEEPFPQSQAPQLPNLRTPGSSVSPAGPSSLSRLLAQAPVENTGGPAESTRPPSPPAVHSPQLPQSPGHTPSAPQHPSALPIVRPGSRASRLSTASKLSNVRMPFVGTTSSAKALATTALAAEQGVSASPSSPISANSPNSASSSVSPEGSPSEGMANMLPHHRRRATSYHSIRNSPLATSLGLPTPSSPSVALSNGVDSGSSSMTARTRLASLASTWGVSFGRKRLNGVSVNNVPLPGTESGPTVSQDNATETDS